jgi:hypothetical protein
MAVGVSPAASSAASSAAANPCRDLSGQIATACKQGLTACQKLSSSQRTVCLTALDNAFAKLRGAGASGTAGTTKTTTTTTTTAATTTTATPSNAAAPPPPVTGVSTDVSPVAGTVLVNGKPLVAGERVPIGATVDTTNGTVTLESVSPTGTLQSARFDGAIFKVEQSKNGITNLLLKGGDFGVCPKKATREVASARATPIVVRSLWGNGHGSFSTTGRYAAATVRGTYWNTEDRCDGTLIRVRRGIVSVLDLVTKKTVNVKAGQSYLAKP